MPAGRSRPMTAVRAGWPDHLTNLGAMTDALNPPGATPGPHGTKIRSFEVTDGPTRAPARAMLRAIGMTDDDWDKPQIGMPRPGTR